jgi:hypothetical protein
VLIQPVSSVTDAAGYYRLINLAPGTYELSADLTGFAPFKRQDILLRGGANFQVDMTMKLASLSESITVAGESPMLEVSNPSNVLVVRALRSGVRRQLHHRGRAVDRACRHAAS